jgi:hypothetical protein
LMFKLLHARVRTLQRGKCRIEYGTGMAGG